MLKNMFVIREIEAIPNPQPPKFPGEKGLKALEAMPGFWKGRAFTRREMARVFREIGDMEAGNRHDREANKYEAIAESGASISSRIKNDFAPHPGP